jgi:hypothetical protein
VTVFGCRSGSLAVRQRPAVVMPCSTRWASCRPATARSCTASWHVFRPGGRHVGDFAVSCRDRRARGSGTTFLIVPTRCAPASGLRR